MNQLTRTQRYLNDPDQMARFRTELLAALYDPDYILRNNIFDWGRFAHEFTVPDFDPPLDSMSFFSLLVQPHFAQSWRHTVLRTRAWWLIRLVEDVPEPVIWLRQQRLQGGRENMARIVERLDHPVITRQVLSSFLYRFKHPPIPDGFLADGQQILVLSGSDPAAAWGIESKSFKQKLIWKVVLCETITPLVNNYNFATLKQPRPSLRSAVTDILDKKIFQPDQILFYSNFLVNRKTRQIVRHTPHSESVSPEPSDWPQLVERWDEDGWPVGQRVWPDSDGVPHPYRGDA